LKSCARSVLGGIGAARFPPLAGGHRAQFNFGDCMSCATAEYLRMPLLFRGKDFRHTSIPSALPIRRNRVSDAIAALNSTQRTPRVNPESPMLD
jgi:hypothetical protein